MLNRVVFGKQLTADLIVTVYKVNNKLLKITWRVLCRVFRVSASLGTKARMIKTLSLFPCGEAYIDTFDIPSSIIEK